VLAVAAKPCLWEDKKSVGEGYKVTNNILTLLLLVTCSFNLEGAGQRNLEKVDGISITRFND
jgi:hypothetical protein